MKSSTPFLLDESLWSALKTAYETENDVTPLSSQMDIVPFQLLHLQCLLRL